MTHWLWLSLVVIVLDQASKQFAESLLTLYESVRVLPFFDFTLLYNKGAAFSFLSDQSGWQRWFFIVLAIVVCVVLVGWLWRLKREEQWIAVALSLTTKVSPQMRLTAGVYLSSYLISRGM